MIREFLQDRFNIATYRYTGGGRWYLSFVKRTKEFYIELDLHRVGFCCWAYFGKHGEILVTIPFLTVAFEW